MKALAFGIVLAIVGLIGAYSYAHSAAVDEPVPATAERWKLQISILNKDGDTLALTMGANDKPAYFPTKAECEVTKKNNPGVANAFAQVLLIAASHGDKVTAFECVLDEPGTKL